MKYIEKYKEMIKNGEKDGYFLLGNYYAELYDKEEEALGILQKGSHLDIDSASGGLALYYCMREDYERAKVLGSLAFESLYKRAVKEDPIALFLVGNYFLSGKLGIGQKHEQGLSYIKRSAKKGFLGAYHFLGSYYREMKNITLSDMYYKPCLDANYMPTYNRLTLIDLEKGTELYIHKAAEKGSSLANMALAEIYETKGDKKKTVEYLSVAAKNGDTLAMYHLGDKYLHGLGVEKDVAMAFMLLSQAAKNGCAMAYNTLGRMYFNGMGVVSDPDYAEIMFLRGAQLGDVHCQHMVGKLHIEKLISNPEVKQGLKYLKLAAKELDVAKFDLAKCYLDAKVCDQDVPKALKLLEPLGAKGHVQALLLLGDIYFQSKHYITSFNYFSKVKDQPGAWPFLGVMLVKGLAGKRDKDGGLKLLEDAKKKNIVTAYTFLADLYLKGEYITQDIKKAKELLGYALRNSDVGEEIREMVEKND